MEWNAKYRDCMRQFWRGDDEKLPEFANRITGSSDLYFDDWRTPTASINFITAHDGFTLHDLVSYNQKHNEANGENNQDGENYNHSWNYGIEGPTDDKKINQLRKQQVRNFLATLFLSQGIPMLIAGDELGRTQHGNNNAYCQDNELSWIDWKHKDQELIDFTSKLIQFRKKHPVFCRRKWFSSQPIKSTEVSDIEWFTPNGIEMSEGHWNSALAKSLGIFLWGQGVRTVSDKGEPIVDDSFYIMFNSSPQAVQFKLPNEKWGKKWQTVMDTYDSTFNEEDGEILNAGQLYKVHGRSVVLAVMRE
jgi:glycogen operon protein